MLAVIVLVIFALVAILSVKLLDWIIDASTCVTIQTTVTTTYQEA